jgi:hypothetical protein
MDAQEFRKDFLENVKAEASATGEGSCASFVSNFAEYLQDAEVLMDFTASFYPGTGKYGKKYRVDGYAFDEFDKTMSLVIADFDTSDEERVLTKTQADQLQERLSYFIDQSLNSTLHREIEMSHPCSDLVDLLRDKRSNIRKYQLFIFTTASMSAAIKTIDTPDIDGVPAECQIWDIERLFKVCASDTGRHIIEINFKEHLSNGIPCLEASDAATKDFKSYLCIIPGKLLADIYDKYGSALLEGNVRSFLSTKVAVNRKIRTTIMQYPERFFAYNNGISATAMDVQFEITPQGRFLVGAKDFQIINGGQTTASLSSARYNYKDKADLSTIFVQMKLTVIENTLEDDSTELIQNISRSSNSQNKVSDADFFSTHPFHVRMEQFSQRLYAKAAFGAQYETKWFYERARGQYLQKQMRLTPTQKKQFLNQNPKNQLITKTDLAKVRNTWGFLPHIVSKGAQTNFSAFAEATDKEWADTDNGLIFNEKYYQETVALMLVFRYTEIMVSHQPWYSQGYRANIVTYTIALLHKLIIKQFPGKDLDLMSIWHKQAVPESLSEALTALSELVYYDLIAPNGVVENVTQWCKREACWTKVQKIEFTLSGELENCLIGHEERKTAEREAKADQRIISGAEIQTKVCCEITAAQWKDVLEFAVPKRMLSPDEHTALRIACQIPEKMPTPAQCKKLIAVLERIQSEGFKL